MPMSSDRRSHSWQHVAQPAPQVRKGLGAEGGRSGRGDGAWRAGWVVWPTPRPRALPPHCQMPRRRRPRGAAAPAVQTRPRRAARSAVARTHRWRSSARRPQSRPQQCRLGGGSPSAGCSAARRRMARQSTAPPATQPPGMEGRRPPRVSRGHITARCSRSAPHPHATLRSVLPVPRRLNASEEQRAPSGPSGRPQRRKQRARRVGCTASRTSCGSQAQWLGVRL